MAVQRLALTRNHVGRYVAAACGLVALALFYQPWVSATLPGVGEQTLSGLHLAEGEAAQRVDRALFGSLAAGGTGAPSDSSGQAAGQAAPGAGASVGGLVMPTRIPTVAAGGAGAAGAAGAAGSGLATGGLVLPTRIPTVTPPASGQFSTGSAPAPAGAASGASGATGGQLAGGGAANTVLEAGRQITREQGPDRLPQFPLYLMPLAGLGLAAFSIIWDRLYEPRDRLFGRLWTLLLAYGGMLGAGYVLVKSVTAAAGNDLLGPGEVTGAAGALWGVFIAFLLGAISITIAWLSPAPAPPERYVRPAEGAVGPGPAADAAGRAAATSSA